VTVQCIYRAGCMSATTCIDHCRAKETPVPLASNLRSLRDRIAAIDCYTAQGARDAGLHFADISTEHVRAFQDHVLDMIDEALQVETPAPRTWTEEHRLLIERIFPDNGHMRCACGLNMPHPYAAGICAPDWRPKHEVVRPSGYTFGYLNTGPVTPPPEKAAELLECTCREGLPRCAAPVHRDALKTSSPLCAPKCMDWPKCECGRGMP
jgi:hypothetical protein